MATKPKLPARKTQAPKQAPRQAPLDLVRNPNFDAAMAQQNYQNSMAEQQARLAAQGGDFTQGRLMGAPTQQDNQKPMYFSAMESELQKQFMDQNPQLRPPAGKAFDPEVLRRNKAEFDKYRIGLNQKYYNDVGQFIPEDQKKSSYPKFLESVVDRSKISPAMLSNIDRLKADYGKITVSPISVTIPPTAPQVVPVVPSNQFNPNVGPRYRGGMNDNKLKAPGSPQQMQDYNKMLQQGMQNNSSNQAMRRLI